MAERTIAQAAVQLGVSTDTIKRRVRRGVLPSKRGADGRILIVLPDEPLDDLQGSAPHLHGGDVATLHERLAATAAERDWLRERVEKAEAEREQLRILLGNAQQQLARALQSASQAPREEPEAATPAEEPTSLDLDAVETPDEPPARSWWQRLLWG